MKPTDFLPLSSGAGGATDYDDVSGSGGRRLAQG